MPGQLGKLLSQLNQVKQSCRQDEKHSDRASLMSLCPEALQTQYIAYGRLLAMLVLYYGFRGNYQKGQQQYTCGIRSLVSSQKNSA